VCGEVRVGLLMMLLHAYSFIRSFLPNIFFKKKSHGMKTRSLSFSLSINFLRWSMEKGGL
jgi:hypothetical protein